MRFLTAICVAFLCLILNKEVLATEKEHPLNETPTYLLTKPILRYSVNDVYSQDLNRADKIQYDGPYGLAIDRLNGYLNKWRNQEMQDWEKTNQTYAQHNQLMVTYNQKLADFATETWWEKNWEENLVTEKGGYTSKTYHSGSELEVLSIRETGLTNTGQIKLGNMGLLLGEAKTPAPAISSTSEIKPVKPINTILPTTSNLSLKTFFPQKYLIKTRYLEVTEQLNATINGSLDPKKILGKIESKTKINVYSRYKREPIIQVTVIARGSPFDKTYEVYFNGELNFW